MVSWGKTKVSPCQPIRSTDSAYTPGSVICRYGRKRSGVPLAAEIFRPKLRSLLRKSAESFASSERGRTHSWEQFSGSANLRSFPHSSFSAVRAYATTCSGAHIHFGSSLSPVLNTPRSEEHTSELQSPMYL